MAPLRYTGTQVDCCCSFSTTAFLICDGNNLQDNPTRKYSLKAVIARSVATWQSAKRREVAFNNRGDLIEFASLRSQLRLHFVRNDTVFTEYLPPRFVRAICISLFVSRKICLINEATTVVARFIGLDKSSPYKFRINLLRATTGVSCILTIDISHLFPDITRENGGLTVSYSLIKVLPT